MRSSAALLAAGLILLAAAGPAAPPPGAPAQPAARHWNFGRTATPQELAGADIDVLPDGAGLPPGQGSVAAGAALYAEKCAACHGEHGEKPLASSLRLTGGRGSLATPGAVQTVGSYWPYAPTLFDYIRRAMPFPAPRSLTADQVYAVTAYVLWLNGIVPEASVLDAGTLANVRMPNRDGFRPAGAPDR